MYKLATPGSDTYHKQIALLLQCYDDLGIHREAYDGNKTKKWEAFRDKFTQELLAEHKILLQGGTNEGKKPSLATLKAWFDKWFKMYDEFAPKFEEGKLNATGNPHDIDTFPLGRASFFLLQQIKAEIKELAANKEKKKEKKAEDDKMAPQLRELALKRHGDSQPISERQSKKAKDKMTKAAQEKMNGQIGSDEDEEESQMSQDEVVDDSQGDRATAPTQRRLTPTTKIKEGAEGGRVAAHVGGGG
jgi:hypothetical protein